MDLMRNVKIYPWVKNCTAQFAFLPVLRQYPWMSDTSLEVRMISCRSA